MKAAINLFSKARFWLKSILGGQHQSLLGNSLTLQQRWDAKTTKETFDNSVEWRQKSQPAKRQLSPPIHPKILKPFR
jgi:hypothetical protein